MYREKKVEVTPVIAGLLCSAILSDTLMFRSPTCTEADKKAAMELAELAGIDVEEHAMKMFEAGSDFSSKTEEEILNQDFKIFHSGDIDFGVAQVSAMGRVELDKVQKRITPHLPRLMGEKKIDMIFVMLTDILNESTVLVYEGDGATSLVKDAFGVSTQNHSAELKGIVSRKKQFIPPLMNTLSEK